MKPTAKLILPILLLAALAGCSGAGRPVSVAQAPVVVQPVATGPILPTPAQNTQVALQTTSVSSGFVDPSISTRLTSRDATEANSAVFYALQFGRPGAPRNWTGDNGTTGSMAVGPYVRVNNLDCRDFTHTVKLSGTDYVRRGTACREQTGNWTVVQGNA